MNDAHTLRRHEHGVDWVRKVQLERLVAFGNCVGQYGYADCLRRLTGKDQSTGDFFFGAQHAVIDTGMGIVFIGRRGNALVPDGVESAVV